MRKQNFFELSNKKTWPRITRSLRISFRVIREIRGNFFVVHQAPLGREKVKVDRDGDRTQQWTIYLITRRAARIALLFIGQGGPDSRLLPRSRGTDRQKAN